MDASNGQAGKKEGKRTKRPFIGMYFKCCHIYTRLYLNKTGRSFDGHCPKCAKRAKVIVTASGSKDRVFQAD